MSDTVESLRRKIDKAGTLGSVVRTMKTMAALNIRQYEEAVRSLADYYRTVELGLMAYLRQPGHGAIKPVNPETRAIPAVVVVFGSDQGLVGQFNDTLAVAVRSGLESLTRTSLTVLSIGERIQLRLKDAGIGSGSLFTVPNSVNAITPLIGDILTSIELILEREPLFELHLYYNSPVSGENYQPVSKRLLPLDETWEKEILNIGPWPSGAIPETPNGLETTRWALVREYLFVSLFRACAESLASENASRLSAMQRAEKNIDDLLVELRRNYNERRQADIDEELFDIISGFQALDNLSR
jgi:F-type H+-transporting ATPase subunit gamma